MPWIVSLGEESVRANVELISLVSRFMLLLLFVILARGFVWGLCGTRVQGFAPCVYMAKNLLIVDKVDQISRQSCLLLRVEMCTARERRDFLRMTIPFYVEERGGEFV